MNRASSPKPQPHPLFVSLAIASMALLVAGVLEVLGPLRALDEALAQRAGQLALGDDLKPLGGLWVWLWAVPVTAGVAWTVVHLRFPWQRWVIVLSSFVLTLGWWPVLLMLGCTPSLSVPVVALLWASAGAMVYAARHATPS